MAGQMTVAGQQQPALGRGPAQQCRIFAARRGDVGVVAGRAQPAAEAAQHLVTQQFHAADPAGTTGALAMSAPRRRPPARVPVPAFVTYIIVIGGAEGRS